VGRTRGLSIGANFAAELLIGKSNCAVDAAIGTGLAH
jgi:hypothetical protein